MADIVYSALRAIIFLYTLGLIVYLCLRMAIGDAWNVVSLLGTFAFYGFLPLIILIPATWIYERKSVRWLLWGLQLLALAFFLLWFGVRLWPAGADNNNAQAPPLSLITFNVFPQNERSQEVIHWLQSQSADLIMLQETPLDMPQLVAQLEGGYPYRAIQERPNGHILLSRFPILEEDDIAFSHYPWPIQQRVVLDVDGQPIAIYNIHLAMPLSDAGRAQWRGLGELLLNYDESIRNDQIRQLIALAKEETIPVIIAGDFNMSEWSLMYDILRDNFKDAYRWTASGLGATWPAGASEELPSILPPILRLDYVWLSDALTPLSAFVGPYLGGDHLPLSVTIGLSADDR